MKKYHVGIDGGVKTGLAVWSSEMGEFMFLETLDFWAAIHLLQTHIQQDLTIESTQVWVEDPSKNKPVFPRKGDPNFRKYMKIAQNVGGVKRESELLIQGIERIGYEVNRIRPSSGKWDAKTFKAITGCTIRTSEHARDAAKLVFGR